jgi:two-component system, NarL family, sensor histidine kinase UhpB
MQSQENNLNILIVEDNPGDFYLIEKMLRSSKIRVKDIYPAARISEACSSLQTHVIDLVLLDLSLPDGFGIDSFLQIKPYVQHIPVIILTGLSESTVAFEALKQGAQDYLVKGEFQPDLLSRSILYSIERKNAEEKIILSEEKYKQIFYKNPFPAWIYDIDSLQILEVNDAAIQAYGYTRGEFLALTTGDIREEKDFGLTRAYHHLAPVESEQGILTRHKKKNGEIILAEATAYPVSYSGKTAMQVLINDVTEKLRLAKELQEQQKQKQQQIAEAILKAQDDERKTLGAELHDNINQILATAKLYITAGLRDHQDHDLLFDMLSKGQDCIVMAIEEIRKLSKALITPGFISTGLRQAIEGMTADIREVKKIDIVTELNALEDTPLSEILQITIYRIIQEQLNNILKHAEASRVDIRVYTNENNITLIVSDNGKGFDTHLRSKGIGITNIQNRAELFNGKVEIDSSPGNGCRLKVMLNIQAVLPQKAA